MEANVKDDTRGSDPNAEREAETKELSTIVSKGASMGQLAKLSETLLAMASGNFGVRADRTFTRDPFDILSYLVNNTADELQTLIGRVERQNTKLESLLEAMADGILLLDAEGSIQRANHAFQTLLGYDSETDVLGKSITDFLTEEGAAIARDLLTSVDESHRLELTFRSSDGGSTTFPVSWSVFGAFDVPEGHVIAVHDDRELRHARTRAQLNDRMAAMGAMAAGVAHEINNPLAYVAANIDYVLSLVDRGESDPVATREALSDALDGVRRVREIVADLNSFSRADNESRSLVPVQDVVESAIKMLGSELRLRTRFDVDLADDLPIIEANEARLVQVFVNILMNALQAMEHKPVEERRLIVRGRLVGDDAHISIEDSGPGISDHDLTRVFDAFFTTKPVGKGTGLGLAISHKTVTNLGGRIDVDTRMGEGTTFTVVLPIDKEATRDDLSGLVSLSEESELIESRNVLIIDDEPSLARALQQMPARDHNVEAVTDPDEEMELLLANDYGAIICDVMMPRRSGIQLYEEMKNARPELAERFIFMTGGAFTPEAQDFLESVPSPCLRKPFDFKHLNELIERFFS